MTVDYRTVMRSLIGCTVDKPTSGTLSGHAAGEPFDKYAYAIIKQLYPQNTYRSFEYLNHLYSSNAQILTVKDRHALHKSEIVGYLLNRSQKATKSWSSLSVFDEKQNDTADILVTDGSTYEIIDVKTKNLSKQAMAPNIISAEKIVHACSLMIDHKEYDKINITYLGIDWDIAGSKLVCRAAHTALLFKANPEALYINWAAALQIQFKVEELDQTFTGSMEEWCRRFIKHYVTKRKGNLNRVMATKILPYEKYVV